MIPCYLLSIYNKGIEYQSKSQDIGVYAKKMGLKAAIYTRVSTEEQRDYGYSIDGQLRELKDYCKKKKYDVVGIYNDAGFSGKNMKLSQ